MKPKRSIVNSQAEQLNQILSQANPMLLDVLSEKSKGMYFPYAGILGQGAQAKGKAFNATVGIACEDDGSPMRLGVLDDVINLSPAETFPYAPSPGNPKLRAIWKGMIATKNPSLGEQHMSLPVVTQALTHGLALAGSMFLDPGEEILIPDPFWDNYGLLFEESLGAKVVSFPCFKGQNFNLDGLKAQLEARKGKKVVLLLNFPNNPTGYTPKTTEMESIAAVLKASAEQGTKLVVLTDDAYFGLVYEEGVAKESIFSLIANLHDNILTVKIDGATKEDYVWGFRVGFITFANKKGCEVSYKAMADKVSGFIRSNISNCSQLSQSLMLKAYTSPAYQAQKEEKYQTLKRRYEIIKEELIANPEYADAFTPLPYNSGYFMCVQPTDGVDAEQVRQLLLEKYDTGLIALQGLLRVAFSSAPASSIAKILNNVYLACKEVKASA
jgi:aspartate/methionine/tyrosine aminotransferase